MYWKIRKPRTFLIDEKTTVMVAVEVYSGDDIIVSYYFRSNSKRKTLEERLRRNSNCQKMGALFVLVHFNKIKKEVDKILVKEML